MLLFSFSIFSIWINNENMDVIKSLNTYDVSFLSQIGTKNRKCFSEKLMFNNLLSLFKLL